MSLTKEEQNLIFTHYESGDFTWLSIKLGKSKNTITEWARRRGLFRKINIRRNGTLLPLFSKTLESYYWLGFIAGDGYIAKNGHFMLSQGEKDKDRIIELAKYLDTKIYEFIPISGYTERTLTYRVNICDIKLGKQLRVMFGLSDTDQKTTTAITLDFIQSKEQAQAFLIGLIDSDGYINSGARIQCHKTWIKVFKNLIKLLPEVFSNSRLKLEFKKPQKDYYTIFSINKSNTKLLYNFAIQNNLNISPRKWKSFI